MSPPYGTLSIVQGGRDYSPASTAWMSQLHRKGPPAVSKRAKCADDPVPLGGAQIIDARDWQSQMLRKRSSIGVTCINRDGGQAA